MFDGRSSNTNAALGGWNAGMSCSPGCGCLFWLVLIGIFLWGISAGKW